MLVAVRLTFAAGVKSTGGPEIVDVSVAVGICPKLAMVRRLREEYLLFES